jgi:hypothetical protein
MTITEEQRTRLLHAYETLMFPATRMESQLSKDEQKIVAEAWMDIINILGEGSIKDALHSGGEWEGADLLNDGHWDAIK